MLEIHPGDGGQDAERFADQLAAAIGRFSNTAVESQGRIRVLGRL